MLVVPKPRPISLTTISEIIDRLFVDTLSLFEDSLLRPNGMKLGQVASGRVPAPRLA